MPRKCCIEGCNNSEYKYWKFSTKSVTFHLFPRDDRLRSIWYRRIQIANNQRVSYSMRAVVCSEHFKLSDFRQRGEKVLLTRSAIPSVFPKSEFSDNEIQCPEVEVKEEVMFELNPLEIKLEVKDEPPSSDEWVDDVIKYDNDISDLSEENTQSTSKGKRERTRKTTVAQFQMMSDFMNSHDKNTIGKVAFNQLWDNLTIKLNEVGPPNHDAIQWRRIWVNYKSKNVKKFEQFSRSKTKRISTSHPEDPIEHFSSSSVVEKHEHSSPKREALKVDMIQLENPKEHQTGSSLSLVKNNDSASSMFQLKVMEKLDVIIEQNKIRIENTEAILAEGKKTNEILQKLLEKRSF